MSTKPESKINQLLQNLPQGTVILASWLVKNGYSRDLQQRYKKSNWLESIGDGAMKRCGETVDLYGGLYALQFQSGKSIHIGGLSSLSLQGHSHYIRLQETETVLFTTKNVHIPLWFVNNEWSTKPRVIQSTMLPATLGLIDFPYKTYTLKISGLARAMMECLEMAPDRFDLLEAFQLMEGLNLLQPLHVQQLLMECKSVKVKRLFLFLAGKADHAWFRHLQISKIDLGTGKRSLVKDGTWIAEYQITVPDSLS